MAIGGGQCGTAGCNAQGAAVSALAQSDSSARFAAPAVDVARSSVVLIPTAKPSPVDVMCNAPSTTGFAAMSFPVRVYEPALSNVACSSDSVGALVAAGSALLCSPTTARFVPHGTGACTTALTPSQCPAWARYAHPDALTVDIVTKNFGSGITAPPQASDFAVTIIAQSVAAAANIGALTYAAVPGIVALRVSVPPTTAAGSASVTVKTGSTATASLPGAFTDVTGSQMVWSVYPQTVRAAGGVSVTVVGTGFSAAALAALTTATLRPRRL